MDEHVLAAIIRLNDTEAFLVIVELHGALVHNAILSLLWVHLNPKAHDCAPCGSIVDGLEGLNVRLCIQRRRNGLIVRPNLDCAT